MADRSFKHGRQWCIRRIKSLVHRTQCRRFENSLLSGLFRIMFCFRLIQQSVLLSLSVRSERIWCRRFRIRDPAAKLRFTNACRGWNQSWLALIGRLSRDAARANLRSRRAPGLGRNHLSCKREYTGCASRVSNVWLFTVATLETIYNTRVILSTGPIFQLLLERPLQFLGFPTTLTFRGLKIFCRGWVTPSINGTSTVLCRRWSLASASRDRTDFSVFRCLIRVRRLSMKRAG